MTLYWSSNRSPIVLLINSIRYRTLKTIKSAHDEANDQPLLKRLRKLSVIGGKKSVPTPPPEEVLKGEYCDLPERRLPMDKLKRMLTLHQEDPLTWNPYVLGRIFKIPESYCISLTLHVLPMVYWHDATHMTEFKRLMKTTFICDVARLKSDDNYLVTYKKIIFPEHKYTSLPKKALPDYIDQVEKEKYKQLGRVEGMDLGAPSVEDGSSLPPRSHHRPLTGEIS